MQPPCPSTDDPSATHAACLAALICENAVLARHLAAAQARCAAWPSGPDPVDAPTPVPASAPTPAAGRPLRRRKLHELPAHAQDLLLALSLSPATLRADIGKALSRMRGQPVQLLGSDADLLYSAMHDMGRRNPLSEALHRRLEARHTLAVRRLAPIREADALRQAWLACLNDAPRPHEEIPAMLWALLTHPLGAAQEVRALAEARSWVFAQARRGQAAADRAAGQRLQDLQSELADLKQRLQHQQTAHARAVEQLELQAARRVGEARRCPSAAQPVAVTVTGPGPVPTPGTGEWAPFRGPQRRAPVSTSLASAARVETRAPAAARAATSPAERRDAATPSPVQGRRVLCVGGIQHAVARYRSRIETLGGRFEHHDGGLHDNAHALDGRLARADLVICQAGCINHAAYHRIKQHCQRTGTPCLYLERASLSRFDRALQGLQAGVGTPTQRPAEAGLI